MLCLCARPTINSGQLRKTQPQLQMHQLSPYTFPRLTDPSLKANTKEREEIEKVANAAVSPPPLPRSSCLLQPHLPLYHNHILLDIFARCDRRCWGNQVIIWPTLRKICCGSLGSALPPIREQSSNLCCLWIGTCNKVRIHACKRETTPMFKRRKRTPKKRNSFM